MFQLALITNLLSTQTSYLWPIYLFIYDKLLFTYLYMITYNKLLSITIAKFIATEEWLVNRLLI